MRSVFDVLAEAALPGMACLSATVVAVVLVFIAIRRVWRRRHFARRDERVKWARENWKGIVSGEIRPEVWDADPLTASVVQEIALDCRTTANEHNARNLDAFFRRSGLLDRQLYIARHARGWRKLEGIQALGRMRAPEAAGVIADCLRSGKPVVAVEAVRALATIRDAALGEALADRLEDGFECPASIVAPALLCCFRETPAKLASLTLAANDALRPLLARILAEVARPGDSCGEAILASDPNPEVRASAARIIAQTRCTGGSGLLDTLAQDQEWFVRLRALIALRVMADRYSIATLMRGLCDSNRLVRLRAAEALACVEGEEIRILELARATCDRYALQALAGEFERCGKLERAITACALGSASARGVLEILVEAGAFRVLAEAARNSPYPIVRSAVDACLHASENPALLEFLVRNGISAGDRKGFHGEDRTDSLVALQTGVGTGQAACGDAIGA